MSARTEMSLRHERHERYTLVESAGADGCCRIRDKHGKEASVKAEWLDFEGVDCWPGSQRKRFHVERCFGAGA